MSDFQKFLDEFLANVKFEETEIKEVQEYDILSEVRELLINTRNELEISQKELSQKTGISQANISKIENGHSIPSLPVLKRLADGLGKRLVVEFVEGEEE